MLSWNPHFVRDRVPVFAPPHCTPFVTRIGAQTQPDVDILQAASRCVSPGEPYGAGKNTGMMYALESAV